ncbi:MAG: DUF4169 family protein [Kiloniellaceae bacterium]
MSEIINLRQAKKRRARAEKEAQAAANRTKFGRTKGARKKDEAGQARAERDLAGKKLDSKRNDQD